MTYNVHACVGLDGRLSPQRIARVIARHDPDVVALQELDVGRARSGGVDQARVIADLLQMLLEFHPVLSVEEERYGDAVLSRLPMRPVRLGRLPALDRQPPLEPRGALWVEVGEGPTALQVVNTHLSLHPVERRRQVEALLGPEWVGGIAPGTGTVLCGDFNALGWFPECRRITRSLRDVQVGHPGHRPRNTFWGRLPLGRIDHIFVDRALEVVHVDVPDDALTRVASDHLPVIVDVRLSQRTEGCDRRRSP
ncbi:MAG TPA: endonuclease/exonuclease/phosphatase family protein [Acidimicrobiia bacterium]|nr:endonuclease/exonuclease/phosphatase family protein [Acidimicrobiia bacterium]